MTPMTLLVLLLTNNRVSGYASTTNIGGNKNEAFVGTLPFHHLQPKKQGQHKYDLGIGKNEPVYPQYVPASSLPNEGIDHIDAAKFWMVQDSSRVFPSPLARSPLFSTSTTEETTVKKRLIPIWPNRMVENDILSIVSNDGDDGTMEEIGRAIIKQLDPVVQLDPNTFWVEMLIHEQQSRFTAMR